MQIEGAQAELSANLAQLSNDDTGLAAQGQAQLGSLAALQRQIDGASPMALVMMRASVAASVAASANLAQQARTAASSTAQGAGASLATASAAARATIADFERDMYEKKIFDPYLRFGSKEDEEAYREREAQRLALTKKAEAERTPQGDLKALDVSIAQMNDAKAHGADTSPDFQSTMAGLVAGRQNLATAMAKDAAPAQDARAAAKPSVDISPDLLASLRATGVTVADTQQNGHGVTAQKPAAVVALS